MRPPPRADDSPVKTLIGAAAALVLGFLQPDAAAGDSSGWWGGLHAVDLQGAPLSPAARWYVVVFISPECPVSNASIPVLNALSAEFSHRGFALVGAYADPTAALADLRAHARDFSISFETADDRSQRLAKAAGASYTPEAAVFTATGTLLYLGRIDDRVGESGAARPAAAHQDLHDVLAAIAAGSRGPFKGVRGYGCDIPGVLLQ
jgi:hypothetical protein